MYVSEFPSRIDNESATNPQPFQYSDADVVLGWNLPEEALHLIHPHWRGYPAPPFFMHLLLALIYFALLVSSAIGNGIVVWIFTTSKSLRTPSNMFIVNLALFDLVMAIEMPMFLANSCAQYMLGYELGCNVFATLGSISGIGAAVSNAVIAYDRFKVISSPIDGRLNFVQGGVLIAFTWLWTLPFTIFPLFKIWGRFAPEGYLTTCSFDYLSDDYDTKVFVAAIFIWSYAIPVSAILIFYGRLFKHVQKHEKMLADQARKMNVKSLQQNKDATSAELRIAKAAFTIFFLFICAWTPYAIVAMIGAYGDRNILSPGSTMIPAIACKSVSCLDPWVYAISHPRYRMELEKRLPWLGITEKATENTSSGDTKSVVTQSSEKNDQ